MKAALDVYPAWGNDIRRLKERRHLAPLLAPALERAKASRHLFHTPAGHFDLGSESFQIPRFHFVGPRGGGDYRRIGIFGGIHGDELSSAVACVELACHLEKRPALATGWEVFIYPACNPSGLEDNTRFSRRGKDLNREFWQHSREAEVRILERELTTLHFEGIISLHSDDTSEGLYGFVRGSELTRHVLEPALLAAESVLPRNLQHIIDGFDAHQGIIEQGYQGILSAPADQKPAPFEIVLETPHLAPMELQVQAHVRAIETILEGYQSFISFGQNL
jgi:protein MpaA